MINGTPLATRENAEKAIYLAHRRAVRDAVIATADRIAFETDSTLSEP